MAKPPTVASLKKVTAENLARLGAERLAEIVAAVAANRPELKRRLRMELAAEQGADHLAVEIDKRLDSLTGSRSKVSWRQRATFIRELDGLRALIVDRLAGLDHFGALERMFRLMATARQVGLRVRDRDGKIAALYGRAAADLGGLIDDVSAAAPLVDALAEQPKAWAEWLPAVLEQAPPGLAAAALTLAQARSGALPVWTTILRLLADAAGDADAYRDTFAAEALKTPSAAADVARRLLGAGRVDEAGDVLQAAATPAGRGWIGGKGRAAEPDFDWEGAWIDYLDAAGRGADAQAARWASFERTLSADRARDFTRRLADFEDVEAEHRAFDHAARHPDAAMALGFLMAWPALPEAAQLIAARADELQVEGDMAEAWAAKLRRRYPAAAHLLLRKAAAAAFRRRDFKTSDRLTHEADAIPLG